MSSKRCAINLVSLLFLLSSISKSLLIKIVSVRSNFSLLYFFSIANIAAFAMCVTLFVPQVSIASVKLIAKPCLEKNLD